MTRCLTINEVLGIHRRVMDQHGGPVAVRDLVALESALAQPQMTFGGEDLYSGVTEKAAILGFLIVENHPFVDGNKRTGHAAMEIFLLLNGFEIDATVDEQERTILQLASGEWDREGFTEWLRQHVVESGQ